MVRRRSGNTHVAEKGEHHVRNPALRIGLIVWSALIVVTLLGLSLASFFTDRSMAASAAHPGVEIVAVGPHLGVPHEAVLREVPQVPARHRRRRTDQRGQRGGRARPVSLEPAEDGEPDRVGEGAHAPWRELDVTLDVGHEAHPSLDEPL